MKTKRVGYIVVGWNANVAMKLCDYADPGGDKPEIILAHGGKGTLFPTYEAARNALRRTRCYAERMGFAWDLAKCRIQALVAPTGGPRG